MTDIGRETALSPAQIARFGPSPADSITRNLNAVHRRIAAACARSGRSVQEVRLMIVTKTVPASILRLVHHAGLSDLGENKLQEARDKHAQLGDLPIRWNIIGHLQSNKTKYLARFAAEFHALDSVKLAEALNVFTTRDITLARRLVAEKAAIREAEAQAGDSHFARLRQGRPESIETSSIHMDVIRDLKRINGHLASVAYPILEAAGELAETRLRPTAPATQTAASH